MIVYVFDCNILIFYFLPFHIKQPACDETTCVFDVVVEVYYDESTTVDLVEEEITTLLDSFEVEIVSLVERKFEVSASETSDISESGDGGPSFTGIAIASLFAGSIFIGLAFLITRRFRGNYDDFSEVQTTSEGDLQSVLSNNRTRSWRNGFDQTPKKTSSKQTADCAETQPFSFPVSVDETSNDTGFEVSG